MSGGRFNNGISTATGSSEWYTPPHIVAALGHFDLDPCQPIEPPYKLAERGYNRLQDGLKMPWGGVETRVWCNPSYEQATMTAFTRRCVEHRNATMLLFARTDTRLWQDLIFPNATAILFIRGRVRFFNEHGVQCKPANAPSALIAFDNYNARMLSESGIKGTFVKLRTI